MSEPRRLLEEEGGSELEMSLLRSARSDGPSAVSRRKTLLALGLAGSAGAAVTATTATTTAATVLGGSGGAVALAKWIAGGVIAGLLTVGVATVVQSSRGDHADDDARPAPRAAIALPTASAVTRAAEAPPAVPDPPREEPSAAKAAPAAPSGAGAVKAAPSLTEEVASVDAARSALAAGDTAGALRALDDHDRRFPGGMLGPEATVVRIEALVHRGDRAAAGRLATAFLAAHPRSPHASHLRSLLGLPPPADAAP
jgi:hypothetical protein